MKHYTKEELELFRNGKMSVLGKITCASHLHSCEECAKILEELKDDDHFIKELQASLQLSQESSENK
ncbi:MAG: hypothetical protein IJW08_10390 [Lentisphaeria bacterium]|nr:hypothetical protein [Lentisphaeria bacterium]MBQ7396935.1 hypothetical protein [Lentisphaeria bacterium]